MQENGYVPATPLLPRNPILISQFMILRIGQITLSTIILSGMLCSCDTLSDGARRQALLDHHLKMDALSSTSEQRDKHLAANSGHQSTNRTPDVIMPLGDPQPLVDEVGLAPEGPSKPFAADPVDEVGLFPED